MFSVLSILTPPVFGAFIGYMTNYVAIRMLFRPLKPWRFLGMRLPMTPGVIPAKRHELAKNIGEMVGGHLFTSADVSRAITEEGFQQELRQLIHGRVSHVLHLDLGPVTTLIPKRFRNYFEAGVKIIRLRLLTQLHAHIESDLFAENLAKTLSSQLDDFLTQDLNDMLSAETQEHFYEFLESTTGRFLASPGVEEWVSSLLSRKIRKIMDQGQCPRDLLPHSMTEQLLDMLAEKSPELLEKLAKLLQEPMVQEKLAKNITAAIRSFTVSLGPLTALMANFLNPEAVDRKVRTFLADNGDDMAQWLYDDSVRRRVAAVLREKGAELLETPFATLLKDVESDKIAQARQWFAAEVAAAIKSSGMAQSITDLVRNGLETQTGRPLHAILTDLFGPDGLDRVKELITTEIISLIRSPQAGKMIDDLIYEMLEQKLLHRPIGKLATFFPGEVQESFTDYLLQQVGTLLVKEVPDLVDSLNIRQIVTGKVNSLDLLRLEGLLMGIMQEQFKYINLFGALLGFIIGLFNLFFLASM